VIFAGGVGHTREQLEERILAIGAADGATDGRVQRGKLRCPGCDSVVLERSGRFRFAVRKWAKRTSPPGSDPLPRKPTPQQHKRTGGGADGSLAVVA
jgi:hypothetical protein